MAIKTGSRKGFAFITINGKKFPSPSHGLNFEIATSVDSARNANAEVISQRVGRDSQKINNLKWNVLDAETWAEMLQEFEKFELTVRYPDMVHNRWTTRKMYPGNRSAIPFRFADDGLPTMYRDCQCNVIDMGIVGDE